MRLDEEAIELIALARSLSMRVDENRIAFDTLIADIGRQFEFVQQQWVNDGKFIGAPDERDPLIGVQDRAEFTIPKRPIRRRMTGLPGFVVNRGGEYCFMPGLRALRWLADLDT